MPTVRAKEVTGLAAPSRVITDYFVEVGKYPLPTAKQELELFKIYEHAKKMLIKQKNALEYAKRTAKSDTIINQLISLIDNSKKTVVKYEKIIPCGYLRFVIQEARKRTHDETLLKELISAGNIGLMIAVKKFRWELGFKFLTYGACWIKVFMQEHIQKATIPVHIPNHIRKEMQRVKVAEEKLIAQGKLKEHTNELPTANHIDFSVLPDHTINVEKAVTKSRVNIFQILASAQLTRIQRLIIYLTYGMSGVEEQSLENITKYLFALDGSSIPTDRIRIIRCEALATLRDYITDEELDVELGEIFG